MPADPGNQNQRKRSGWRRFGLAVALIGATAVAAGFVLIVIWTVLIGGLFDVSGNEDEIACDEFEFSRADWLAEPEGGPHASRTITERERIASAFYRCGTLHRKPRAEVEAMIGKGWPARDGSKATYDIGWVNDAIGPGDGWEMIVRYDGENQVSNLPGREDPPGVNQ